MQELSDMHREACTHVYSVPTGRGGPGLGLPAAGLVILQPIHHPSMEKAHQPTRPGI